jgi:hypothetical protein
MLDWLPDKTVQAQCDGCGKVARTGLKSFRQAAICLKHSEGWQNHPLKNGWSNLCPRCAEQADNLDVVGIGFARRPLTDD